MFAVRVDLSSRWRGYRSVLVLAGAAAIFLIVAAPARAALAGAGLAVLGAAVTRAVDLDRERKLEEVQAEASRRRDLDETRRLAYAVLNARRSRDAMITATLVNALAHHGLVADPNVAAQHVTAVLNAPGLASDSERWLQQQIDRINHELGPPGHPARAQRRLGGQRAPGRAASAAACPGSWPGPGRQCRVQGGVDRQHAIKAHHRQDLQHVRVRHHHAQLGIVGGCAVISQHQLAHAGRVAEDSRGQVGDHNGDPGGEG